MACVAALSRSTTASGARLEVPYANPVLGARVSSGWASAHLVEARVGGVRRNAVRIGGTAASPDLRFRFPSALIRVGGASSSRDDFADASRGGDGHRLRPRV